MAENLDLLHERVDDVPLLIGLMKRLQWPEVLDRHLGNHGHHQGLSNGWLVVGWLAYILSQGDHRKSRVQEWAEHLAETLARLLGQPVRPTVEFDDDRLGIVLHRLSDTAAWEALEAELWQSCLAVYEIELTGVRLDSTTTYGYHTPQPEGLMQRGYSKDHRPDLPQLKLMAAAAEPAGHLLACDVHPGQRNDDGLYLPLIARLRHLLGRHGVLYVGDCKMAALGTRADIVSQGDYYLTVLPQAGEAAPYLDRWIAAAADGTQPTQPLYAGERLLAEGYEFSRPLEASVDGQAIVWQERVQVVRSVDLAQQMQEDLSRRLAAAEAALWTLTPGAGRGKRQYHEEAALSSAVQALLAHYRVTGLLKVQWERQERPSTRPKALWVQYVIHHVARDEVAIGQHMRQLAWRVQVTNLPAEQLSLESSVLHYRGGWCLERDFHLVKDLPLGISPLYVRQQDQIIGLTRLLTLGLRLLTLIEIQVRRRLAEGGESLAGLYEGQLGRTTDRPTALRLLRVFARTQITLTRLQIGPQQLWHITPLPPLAARILQLLNLPADLYACLANTPP